jgi:hypothetical protein
MVFGLLIGFIAARFVPANASCAITPVERE